MNDERPEARQQIGPSKSLKMPKRLTCAGFCLLGVILPSPSPANKYADNPWEEVDRRTDGFYNPIGVIETLGTVYQSDGSKGKGTANAWIISPCYAVTNNHAVFGDAFPEQPKTEEERATIGREYAVRFSVGVGRSLGFAGSVTAVPVRWGRRTGTDENDWALLKMNSCLGTRAEIGFLPIDVNRTFSGLRPNISRVKTVFFYMDQPSSRFTGKVADTFPLVSSLGCVYGYHNDNKTYRYSASTYPGGSGAPVMYLDADGLEKVIGIHRGGHRRGNKGLEAMRDAGFPTYTNEFGNEFINIRDIIESQDVKNLLKDDFLSDGRGDPNFLHRQKRPPFSSRGAKECSAKEPGKPFWPITDVK